MADLKAQLEAMRAQNQTQPVQQNRVDLKSQLQQLRKQPTETTPEPVAPVDNRGLLQKFGDAGGKVLGTISKYSGMEGLVGSLAKIPGEFVASTSELAGKEAPKWTMANRLSSPETRAALKYGITPEAKAAAEAEKAQGAKGAGFTDVLNIASVLPGGLVGKAGTAVKEAATIGRGGALVPLLKEGAKTGAKWGAGYGAAGAADEGKGFSDIATGAVEGGVTGAALGIGLSAAGAGLSKATTLFDKNAQKQNLISSRQKELSRLENSYASVRTATEKARERGFDPQKTLAETDLLHGAVDTDGTIRTTQEGGAVGKMQNFIKPKEKVISNLLDLEGKSVNIADIEKNLRYNIDSAGLEGEALDAAHAKIDKEIKGLLRRADDFGNVPVSKLQDAKVSKYANLNYLDPGSKNADKSIARTYKDLIEKNTESADVKALNEELSQHYSVMGLLEKLDGKKVAGGRLGKYFAQTTGAIIGSHFGPIGGIVGAEVGGGIKGALMKNKFRGQTGVQLEDSPAMKAALEKIAQSSNNLGSLKTNQSNTIIPTKTGISPTVAQLPAPVKGRSYANNGMPINLPGKGILEGQANIVPPKFTPSKSGFLKKKPNIARVTEQPRMLPDGRGPLSSVEASLPDRGILQSQQNIIPPVYKPGKSGFLKNKAIEGTIIPNEPPDIAKQIQKIEDNFRKEADLMAPTEGAEVRQRNVTDAVGGVNFVANEFKLNRAKSDMFKRAGMAKDYAKQTLYENDPAYKALVDKRDAAIESQIDTAEPDLLSKFDDYLKNEEEQLKQYAKEQGTLSQDSGFASENQSKTSPLKVYKGPSKYLDIPEDQLPPRSKKVSPESSLIQEAKKYKSADEFVKAQGETVYRGGKELSGKNITDAGVSVASHKKIAEDFVKQKGGTVSEYKISPEAKIVDFQDVPNVKFKNLNDYSPELDTGDRQIWRDLEVEYQKAINWAKQNGYDAVKLPLEREVRVINPDVLKTKSQLTDIWNQANKKSLGSALKKKK